MVFASLLSQDDSHFAKKIEFLTVKRVALPAQAFYCVFRSFKKTKNWPWITMKLVIDLINVSVDTFFINFWNKKVLTPIEAADQSKYNYIV